MTCVNSNVPPAAVLLVQPTGGGKSLLQDSYATGQSGLHWSISPLLSLTDDQESKLNSSIIQDDSAFIAVHLDVYKTNAQRTAIVHDIFSLPP
jgi:superfamily II DNA helicase RecQ